MAQTNFTASDMYPKSAPAVVSTPAPKAAKKKPEPVVEAPIVEEVAVAAVEEPVVTEIVAEEEPVISE